MTQSLKIFVFGLSLSSSWGNGHATTFRALIRGLSGLGHNVHFLERDVPWYAENRDLPDPGFCAFDLYQSLDDVVDRFGLEIAGADVVLVGSYVPEGADLIDRLAPLVSGRFCFYDIDTPVTLAKLKQGEETCLARRQIPVFDTYFSFSGGEVLRRLEDKLGARRAEALFCSVDDSRYHPIDLPVRWDLGYLGTYSPDRQPTLEKLLIEPARRLPDRLFVVAGPQYPDDIDWPDNVDRIEHLPPEEHAAFYNRQRFTLNVTRADMIAAGWSPSVRLFEAAACGTPIVSDNWRGLSDLFPDGEAITIAHSSGDVVRLLAEPTSRGAAMAHAARAIVLGAHTGRARAIELVDKLARESRSTPHSERPNHVEIRP